jgi:hypothetical protein
MSHYPTGLHDLIQAQLYFFMIWKQAAVVFIEVLSTPYLGTPDYNHETLLCKMHKDEGLLGAVTVKGAYSGMCNAMQYRRLAFRSGADSKILELKRKLCMEVARGKLGSASDTFLRNVD